MYEGSTAHSLQTFYVAYILCVTQKAIRWTKIANIKQEFDLWEVHIFYNLL